MNIFIYEKVDVVESSIVKAESRNVRTDQTIDIFYSLSAFSHKPWAISS